ncbi:MAG: hypothetical protein IPI35_03740 [Deltaproteobacteria bacterium]|nr:hypothetical protein [Deltaproteobacteria bacterium]
MILSLLILAACAVTATPDAAAPEAAAPAAEASATVDLQAAYKAAVADAATPTPEEIVNTLTVISAENPALVWEAAAGGSGEAPHLDRLGRLRRPRRPRHDLVPRGLGDGGARA